MVETTELASKRTEPERTLTLVAEAEAAIAIFKPDTASSTTLMPNQATATASQDIPATPTTTHTLLLLTSGPQFDRTATPAHSKPAKSSAS